MGPAARASTSRPRRRAGPSSWTTSSWRSSWRPPRTPSARRTHGRRDRGSRPRTRAGRVERPLWSWPRSQWTDAERERVEPAPEDVEQLALLDVEPRIADEVGAAPLREPDPAEQQAEREQQDERTRATLAEARRAAEAAEQQRRTRDAVAEARAAVQALMAAEAERGAPRRGRAPRTAQPLARAGPRRRTGTRPRRRLGRQPEHRLLLTGQCPRVTRTRQRAGVSRCGGGLAPRRCSARTRGCRHASARRP